MISKPYHYTKVKPKGILESNDSYSPNYRTIYKVKVDKIPFLVYIEEFDGKYSFVKFFPSRYRNNSDKYRLRFDKFSTTQISRLLVTCVEIANEEMQNNPDFSFGIYGAWDSVDVKRQKKIKYTTSQRYRVWKLLASTVIDFNKYKFIRIADLNFFMAIPLEKYSSDYIKQFDKYFRTKFGDKFHKLVVPDSETHEAKTLDSF